MASAGSCSSPTCTATASCTGPTTASPSSGTASPKGVAGLRAEVETLYREGIDRSKLAQWGAAHDLVARYVPPTSGSTWAAGVRAYPDVEDPRGYIDDVNPDEFPLSMFYTSLKQKLAPVIARPSATDSQPSR